MKKNHTLLLPLLLMVSTSWAEETHHQMERFTKTVGINQPTRIKIINHYGDIRVRKADDNQFIYHGVAQSQNDQEVTLDYQQNKEAISITVKYSKPEQVNALDRFDLALIVPPMASLDIEIEGGNLTTKGLGSDVKVRSEDADIQVKTSSPVDLFTKSGSVELSIKPNKTKIQSNIQTHNGSVHIYYYSDMPRFEINTGRHVTSNSSSLLKSLSKETRTAFYGDVNNNHHLTVKTDTGHISLIDSAQ